MWEDSELLAAEAANHVLLEIFKEKEMLPAEQENPTVPLAAGVSRKTKNQHTMPHRHDPKGAVPVQRAVSAIINRDGRNATPELIGRRHKIIVHRN